MYLFQALADTEAYQQMNSADTPFNYLPVGSYNIRASEINGVDGGLGSARIQVEGDVITVDIKFNGFGIVSGTVYSSDGVTPAAGAEARISVTGPFARSYTVQTGSDGRFRFTDVPVGIFNIAAKLLGTTLGGAGSGAITANGQEINIDIRIQDSGNITGTVYKPDGATLAEGIGVILTGSGYTLAEATDSQGRFIFENIPLGSFTLRFEDPFGNGIAFHRGSLNTNGQQYDVGNIVLDDQAIHVAGIEPFDGSVNIPVNSQIKIIFSERPDSGTINSNTIKLYDNKGAVSGSLSMADNDTAVIFAPTGGLKGQTRYNLIVSTGIKDLVGRNLPAQVEGSFVTADDIPPAILSISPANNATDVPSQSVVRIVVSEPIDPATVTASNFIISGPSGNLDGRIDVINSNTVIVFTPLYPLSANSTYNVRLSGIKDVVGNTQAEALNTIFSTIDIIPPAISSLSYPVTAKLVNGTDLTITANSADADIAYIDFIIDDRLIGTAASPPFTLNLKLLPAIGSSTITVKAIATDKAGNKGAAVYLTINVQPNQAPAVQITNAPAQASPGEYITVTVNASDDVGIKEIILNTSGELVSTQIRQISGLPASVAATFSLRAPTTMRASGTIVLKVISKDFADVISSEAETVISMRDTILPIINISSSAANNRIRPNDAVAVNITAQDNKAVSQIDYTVSGIVARTGSQIITPPVTPANISFNITVPADAIGGNTITVNASAIDEAGNRGNALAYTLRVSGSSLIGRVTTGQDNSAIAGAALTLRSGANVYTSSTDVYGDYRFTGLDAGTYTIIAEDANTGFKAYAMVIIYSDQTTTANLKLAPTGNVRGAVFNRDGITPAGANIDVAISGAGYYRSAKTDANSQFSFEIIPVGSFTVNATGANGERGRTGGSIINVNEEVNINVVYLGKGRVTGFVRDANSNPVPSANITLTNSHIFGTSTYTATAGSNGSYAIEGVFVGTFTVSASDSVTRLSGFVTGSIASNGEEASANITLSSSGTVTGTVYRYGGTTAAANIDARLLIGGSQAASTTTDVNGRYTFQFVPIGSFVVDVTDSATGDRGRTTNQINANNETRTVNVVLNGVGSAVVTVRDAGGNPVSDANVIVNSGSQYGGTYTGATDANGTAAFNNVLAGSISVSATSSATGLSGYANGTVAQGGTVNINITLQQTGTITGTIYMPDGITPAAGMDVRLYRGYGFVKSVISSSDGVYRFDYVPVPYTYSIDVIDRGRTIRAKGGQYHSNKQRPDCKQGYYAYRRRDCNRQGLQAG